MNKKKLNAAHFKFVQITDYRYILRIGWNISLFYILETLVAELWIAKLCVIRHTPG